MFRTLALLLSLVSCVAQETSRAVIKTESRLVLVEALVTNKKGEPVRGLTQKDFKLLEDNREQTITSFSVASDPASTLNGQPRYLMFFFDNTSVDMPHQQPLRDAAAQFVAANAGPRRLMSVVEFGPGVRVTQDFTGDGERLKQAMSATKLAHKNEGNYDARQAAWALESMAKLLGKVPGRKSLVLVSGGMSQIPIDQVTRLTDALNKANVALYPGVDLNGLSSDPMRGNPKELESLSAAGPSGGGDKQQLLRSLMDNTGGSLFYLKDLAGGFERISNEPNDQYQLGYVPDTSDDGKCHHLKVKVSQSGAVVRARNFYCPVKPADLLSGTPVEKDMESLLAGTGASGMKVSAQAPFFYSDSGVARLSVAFEFPTSAVTLEKRKGNKFHGQVNVLGVFYRPDGGLAARFSDAINFDFDDKTSREAWKQKGLAYYEKDVEAAPGAYTLKLVISAGADRAARVDVPVQIPVYDSQKLGMSGLALSTSTRKVGEVTGVESEDNTPLIANGMQFFPAARTVFKKTEPVALYAELYEPLKGAVASVRMRLFDVKTGQVKLDSGQMKQEGSGAMALMIPVAKLEGGEYLCELVGTDPSGGRARRLVNFTVE